MLRHDATKKYRDIAFGSSAERITLSMESRVFSRAVGGSEPRMQ
ncbi:MAG: hypothetical protein ACP5N9_04995 [Candidatus Bilamarchaeum sp.]